LGLLEDLELLAESNTILHFDGINRVGLDDEEPEVRTVAIRSLWQSEREDLVPIFLNILDADEADGPRAQAAAGLGRFVYLGELGKIGKERLTKIETALLETMDSDFAPLIRRRALEALGYSSHGQVPDLIENAYLHGDEDWQASALYAMGRSADDRWAPLVLERLEDTHELLSREAARAAGELQINEALPGLINLLYDELPEVRLAAAWSISQIGGEGASEALEDLLERTEDEDEIDLIENAMENLAFNEELEQLNILDFSEEDLENLISQQDKDELFDDQD
jgi:HEAT repeat protein